MDAIWVIGVCIGVVSFALGGLFAVIVIHIERGGYDEF